MKNETVKLLVNSLKNDEKAFEISRKTLKRSVQYEYPADERRKIKDALHSLYHRIETTKRCIEWVESQ